MEDREGDEIEWVVCPRCNGSEYEDKKETNSSSSFIIRRKCDGEGRILVKKKDRNNAVL